MQQRHQRALACALVATTCLIGNISAAEPAKAKDIVLTRLAGTPVPGAQSQQQTYGMAVSVLVAGPDGLLRPRPTDTPFQTGEKFRLRILPTVDGTAVVANTNPQGITTEVLRIPVRAGLETLIPSESDSYLQLVGNGGEDLLHVQVYPTNLNVQPINDYLRMASKDIRLVSESTNNASYVAAPSTQPLYTRVVVRHQR